MKATRLQICFLVFELLGVVALFLPFTWGISPWEAVFAETFFPEFRPLALPAFLAVLVWLGSLRRLFPKPPTKAENWTIIILAALGFVIPLLPWVQWVYDLCPRTYPHLFLGEPLLDLVMSLLLYLVVPTLLMVTVLQKVSLATASGVAIRLSYVSNAVFCIYLFTVRTPGPPTGSRLDIGGILVAATVVLYLVEIVYFTRQGLKQSKGVRA